MVSSSFSLSSLVNSLFGSTKKSRRHHRHHSSKRNYNNYKFSKKRFSRKNMKYRYMKGG